MAKYNLSVNFGVISANDLRNKTICISNLNPVNVSITSIKNENDSLNIYLIKYSTLHFTYT